ncbi:MAG: carbohydrate binding family 9 domain-containing protein [Henriciella sp.]
MTRYFAFVLLLVSTVVPLNRSYAEPDGEPVNFKTYRPSVSPIRINTSQAPIIDGDLSDPVWDMATQIVDFYQVEPFIAPPTVETKVYMAFDENALYIGVFAAEDRPEDIYATVMERDGDVWRDDMIRVYIDPFATGISGFGFDVNAIGARADRLVQDGRRPIDEWDTIWNSSGQILENGWSVEIEIPFRSISFDPEADGWGLILTRERAHKAEEIRWAGIDQSLDTFNFSRAGRLEGIRDVNQGRGLEITLQGTGSVARDWSRPRQDSVNFEPSVDALYRFTPSLAGLITFNSDFSDTPLDNRQINTGRFSLFFPETRDFFLQDAAFFEFGGRAFSRAPNARPFFSRRIGIVNGESVPIETGIKLSGELKGIELGLLTARMGEGSEIDRQTLSVARAAVDISAESRLGIIATNGDPTGQSDNTLLGFDYLYRSPSIFGKGRLQADIYYQQTFSSTVPDDDTFGIRIDYPNDVWRWKLAAREVGENFTPALGFVNRPGSRDYTADWQRRFRPQNTAITWWQFGSEHRLITALDGETETRTNKLKAGLQTRQADSVWISTFATVENVRTPFTLPNEIPVPTGTYNNDGASLSLTSSMTRPYGGQIRLEQKQFFGGDSTALELRLNARPNRNFDISAAYSRTDINVPGGDVSVQVGSVDAVVNLSPKLSISTQTQYDNISNSLSFFGRMRWEVRPETEIFLSVGHGAIIDDSDFGRNFRSIQSQAIFRLSNTYRF